jgi:hypothetical protein
MEGKAREDVFDIFNVVRILREDSWTVTSFLRSFHNIFFAKKSDLLIKVKKSKNLKSFST